MNNVTATAIDGTSKNYSVFNDSSAARIRNSSLTGTGPNGSSVFSIDISGQASAFWLTPHWTATWEVLGKSSVLGHTPHIWLKSPALVSEGWVLTTFKQWFTGHGPMRLERSLWAWARRGMADFSLASTEEGCQSGRMGRPRKPLKSSGFRGFESHAFRHVMLRDISGHPNPAWDSGVVVFEGVVRGGPAPPRVHGQRVPGPGTSSQIRYWCTTSLMQFPER
jgi:hypothetical protein